MQKVFLDKIPIIELDELTEAKFNNLVDEILVAIEENDAQAIQNCEKQINEHLISMYKFTDQEQKIIEEA